MDRYNLRADPCDNRLIRCENFVVMLNCIVDIIATFVPALRELEHILQEITNCTAHSLIGMMVSQTLYEYESRNGTGMAQNHPFGVGKDSGYINAPGYTSSAPLYPQQHHHHHQGGMGIGGTYGAVPATEVVEVIVPQRHHHQAEVVEIIEPQRQHHHQAEVIEVIEEHRHHRY